MRGAIASQRTWSSRRDCPVAGNIGSKHVATRRLATCSPKGTTAWIRCAVQEHCSSKPQEWRLITLRGWPAPSWAFQNWLQHEPSYGQSYWKRLKHERKRKPVLPPFVAGIWTVKPSDWPLQILRNLGGHVTFKSSKVRSKKQAPTG